ncbi:MAG: prepilin-type N-terminal cleavage/methylation domain-containing protein [Lentimonas sp.]
MKTVRPQIRSSNGFTLIELLTVIAIVAILAAILIPSVSKVREKARTATSLSNLRQIGTAIGVFQNFNGGRFPSGFINEEGGDGSNVYDSWVAQIAHLIDTDQETQVDTIFVSPNATLPLAPRKNAILSTYSYHDQLGRNTYHGPDPRRYPTANTISNLPSLIIVADSAQNPGNGGQANATFYQPANSVKIVAEMPDGDSLIPVGPDSDNFRGTGWFRYRNGGHVNVLMADGHVESIKKGEVKRKNVSILIE